MYLYQKYQTMHHSENSQFFPQKSLISKFSDKKYIATLAFKLTIFGCSKRPTLTQNLDTVLKKAKSTKNVSWILCQKKIWQVNYLSATAVSRITVSQLFCQEFWFGVEKEKNRGFFCYFLYILYIFYSKKKSATVLQQILYLFR